MVSPLRRRPGVVRVDGGNGSFATGIAIGSDLVLTARHVVKSSQLRIMLEGSTTWIDASAVWDSAELDAALLRVDAIRQSGEYVRWAVGGRGTEATASGYPVADQDRPDELTPLTEVRVILAGEDGPLVRGELVSAELAVGVSGGALTSAGGELVGMVIGQTADGELLATSVAALHADEGFAATANSSGRTPVVLAESDLRSARALLSAPRPLQFPGGPFTGGGALPFVGRERELAALKAWCASSQALSMAVLHGRWGSGKTALAGHLCQMLTAQGWSAGFLELGRLDWGRRVVNDAPTLFVIDYSEAWGQSDLQRAMDLVATEPYPLRFLLVGRQDITGWARPDLSVSLDRALDNDEKTQFVRLVADAAGLGVPETDELRQFLVSANTFLDVLLAISLLADEGVVLGQKVAPSELLPLVGRTWLDRWCASLERGGMAKDQATHFVRLALLLRPKAEDTQRLLSRHFQPEVANTMASALFATFRTTDGRAPDLPDVILAAVLKTSNFVKIMTNAFTWAVDNPEYATDLLTALGKVVDAPADRHLLDVVGNWIERLAEAVAPSGMGGLRAALDAFIDKAAVPEKMAQEWRAAIRQAEGVAPIRFGGLADRRAKIDQLGRTALINALVDMVTPGDHTGNHVDATGPTVIAVDGPWGSGKTSVMGMVRDRLDALAGAVNQPSGWWRRVWRRRRFVVGEAVWRLYRRREEPEQEPDPQADAERRSVITVWFNPWAHQSSEQVWAGLARAILVAINARMYQHDHERARYWLLRNAGRLDRARLRKHLLRSVRSPMLKVAFFGLLVPIAAALLRYDKSFRLFGEDVSATRVAAFAVVGVVVLALLHTVGRFLFGRAAVYCPPGVLDGPVLSGTLAQPGGDPSVRDPLYHARSGYLYLLQHDIRQLLVDAANHGFEVVVFIDDLDRCTPKTTAEVLEAVNLFLSEAFPATRFVIGLDMSVVADQIDDAMNNASAGRVRRYVDDPTMSWTFLRKLVQLPVLLPRIPDTTLDNLVGEFLGPVDWGDDVVMVAPRPVSVSAKPEIADSPAPLPTPRVEASAPDESDTVSAVKGEFEVTTAEAADRRVTQLESNPEIRQRISERLRASPLPSARETKRLLTTWQFYVRVLTYHDPSLSGAAEIRRARAAVLVAEMVVRWPALLPDLLKVEDGCRGLRRLLDASSRDDIDWIRTVTKVGINHTKENSVCTALREILSYEDGPQAVVLADLLF